MRVLACAGLLAPLLRTRAMVPPGQIPQFYSERTHGGHNERTHRFATYQEVDNMWSIAMEMCASEDCCADGPPPSGDFSMSDGCWDSVFSYERCCTPGTLDFKEKQRWTVQVTHYLIQSAQRPEMAMYGEPLCPPGGGNMSGRHGGALPELLGSGPARDTVQLPLALSDLAVVVMTNFREIRRSGGLVENIGRTWARRLPVGAVTLVTNADEPALPVPRGMRHMRVPCPDFWSVHKCDSWHAASYLGTLGLERVLQERPDTSWFMLVDDDAYVRVDRLTEYLWQYNASVPVCLGRAGAESILDTGNGVVCSNAAMRLLYPHLVDNVLVTAYGRWVVSALDCLLKRCFEELDIPTVDLTGIKGDEGFFLGSRWSRHSKRARKMYSYHRVRTTNDFDRLEHRFNASVP